MIEFLPPIPLGLGPAEVVAAAEQVIEPASDALMSAAGLTLPVARSPRG